MLHRRNHSPLWRCAPGSGEGAQDPPPETLVTDRREFLKESAAVVALIGAHTQRGELWRLPAFGTISAPLPGRAVEILADAPEVKSLLMAAINTAQTAGAAYADARIQRLQQNFVLTREHQILNIVDTDTLG